MRRRIGDLTFEWLANGFVHVRDLRSGLQGLYEPSGWRHSGDLRVSSDAILTFVAMF